MNQKTMFPEFEARELTAPAAEQQRQLERVASNIAESVIDFLWMRGTGGTFTGAELQAFVAERHPTAPASADRSLRDLRAKGRVAYTVTNRAASMYRIDQLGE